MRRKHSLYQPTEGARISVRPSLSQLGHCGLPRQRRSVIAGCVLVGASVLGQALWMYDSVAREISAGDTKATEVDRGDIVLWPLQTIAAFPYRDQIGALIVYPVVLMLVGALLVAVWRRGSPRARLVMMVSLAATLVFPFVFTVLTFTSIGNIWQGRYVLPYGVGFLLLAGYALGCRRTDAGPPLRVLYPAAAVYGFAVAACLIKVRNDELADNPASSSDSAWHAPWPILLVLLVAGGIERKNEIVTRAIGDEL